jgi:hypothetical protein
MKDGKVAKDPTPGTNAIAFETDADGFVDVKGGDQIKIDGVAYEFVGVGKTAADGNVGIEWGEEKTVADLATALETAMGQAQNSTSHLIR